MDKAPRGRAKDVSVNRERQALPNGEAAARAPRARAYAQAQRHSRRVRRLRWLIPLGATLGIGTVFGLAYFDPFGRIKDLSLSAIQVSGSKVTMVAPRLTGQRNNGRGYELSARSAEQDVRKPGFVELREMNGRVVMDESGNRAHIKAGFGVFNTSQEQLELTETIHVRTDGGQEISLRSASVDFKAGTVRSSEPVSVVLSNGQVEADSLSVADNGQTISFVGRVRATFAAPAEAKAEAESAAKTGPRAEPDVSGRPATSPAAPPPPAPAGSRQETAKSETAKSETPKGETSSHARPVRLVPARSANAADARNQDARP